MPRPVAAAGVIIKIAQQTLQPFVNGEESKEMIRGT